VSDSFDLPAQEGITHVIRVSLTND
jgi:hypothetical protein